jgi:hypothetical protein
MGKVLRIAVGDLPPKPLVLPFMGEEMTCHICGRSQVSDPNVSSNWWCVLVDGGSKRYYCTKETVNAIVADAVKPDRKPDDATRGMRVDLT